MAQRPMLPNNALERTREKSWAASGRGTAIVAGRSTQPLARMEIFAALSGIVEFIGYCIEGLFGRRFLLSRRIARECAHGAKTESRALVMADILGFGVGVRPCHGSRNCHYSRHREGLKRGIQQRHKRPPCGLTTRWSGPWTIVGRTLVASDRWLAQCGKRQRGRPLNAAVRLHEYQRGRSILEPAHHRQSWLVAPVAAVPGRAPSRAPAVST